jgi:hypothetical protein
VRSRKRPFPAYLWSYRCGQNPLFGRRCQAHWLGQWPGPGGRCQPHTADTPYAPWRNIWNDLIGLNDSMSAQEQAATVAAWTLSLVPDAGDDVGLWAEVLGLPMARASG